MKTELFNLSRWYDMRYDGRKKIFRGITRDEFKTAVNKHFARNFVKPYKPESYEKSELRRAYEYAAEWSKPEHGSYRKIVMRGHTWLYLCSPIYGHADYNKARLLEMRPGREKAIKWFLRKFGK